MILSVRAIIQLRDIIFHIIINTGPYIATHISRVENLPTAIFNDVVTMTNDISKYSVTHKHLFNCQFNAVSDYPEGH